MAETADTWVGVTYVQIIARDKTLGPLRGSQPARRSRRCVR